MRMFYFSLQLIFTLLYILFYQMHRNLMHTERIEVGLYTIISPLSISNRI